jgi:hypothetical protein
MNVQRMAVFNPTLEPVEKLFRFWLRFITWGLRITPVCFVIALPALALFDHFSPWPPAIQALSVYSGQSRVCVGYASNTERTATVSHSLAERSFLLFPRALTSPSIITVTATDGASIKIDESSSAFWFLFVIYTVAVIFCVRCFRSIAARAKP